MGWSAVFDAYAERDLKRLGFESRRRIIEKIEWLGSNFDSLFPSILGNEFREFYKLRVGDWRVIYTADWNNKILIIRYINRRDKVYKKKRK